MINAVYISGQRVRLDPAKSIGKGGEADVFNIGGGKALKVYKPQDHPDLVGEPHNQLAARRRIELHQTKLRAFPLNLPPHVVTLQDLAFEDAGEQRIAGYTMRLLGGMEVLLQLTDPAIHKLGLSNDTVTQIFRDLHTTVSGLHVASVAIGDFNDLNVLTSGEEAHIIDADSFQWGSFPSYAFTDRFVDPLLVRETTDQERRENANMGRLMLARPYTSFSDWYAFAVMLMQCLLCVGPYGGVYVPKNLANRIPHPARPLHRITVFHPDVRYPKPAIPREVLPDELLGYFQQIFEKDMRGVFPLKLLEMRWTTCSNCKAEHARGICPFCATQAPGAKKEVTRVKGKVVATEFFNTRGRILFASVQGGKLRYLYHENGQYKREEDKVVLSGQLNSQMRFRIQGDTTLLGQDGRVVVLSPGKEVEQLRVDSFGTLPMFDANESSRYWLQQGQLLRSGQWAPEHVGDVLNGQTLFWVGSTFGFGFYRAGGLSVAFVFDASRNAINDNVQLGPIRGQLVDSTCVFTRDKCWFFLATQQGGRIIHHCFVIRLDGTVEATAQAEKDDGSWLGTIRGKCAAGDYLLAATDEGIVRVAIDNGQLGVTSEFPDTEPFVDSASHLFPGAGGLHVVSSHTITLLKIS